MSTKSRAPDIVELLTKTGKWMTRREIADALGMHRFAVAQPISRLEDDGIIETKSAGGTGPQASTLVHRIAVEHCSREYISMTALDKRIAAALSGNPWQTQAQLQRKLDCPQTSVTRAMRRLTCLGIVERRETTGKWCAPEYRLLQDAPRKNFDDPNSPWKGWALGRALGGLGYNTREAQQWRQ